MDARCISMPASAHGIARGGTVAFRAIVAIAGTKSSLSKHQARHLYIEER